MRGGGLAASLESESAACCAGYHPWVGPRVYRQAVELWLAVAATALPATTGGLRLMPWYDMPLEQLREYRTSTPEPEGLDEWWAKRLEAARAQARPATFTAYEPDVYAPVRGVRRRVLRGGRRPDPRVVHHARRRGERAGRGQVHRLRRRPGRAVRAHAAARARLRGARHGQPRPGRPLDDRGHAGRPGRHRRGELPGHDPGHRLAGGLLLHPDVHRRGARRGRGAASSRAPDAHGRGHRRQPGRRARARLRRAAPGRGQRVPRGRAVPLRHPAGDHPRAALAVHRDPGVPGGERRAHRHRAEHAALRRLRAARPPDHRHRRWSASA